MDLELEWYEQVRNGYAALCDRCIESINIDDFHTRRNQNGVYCGKCWNWIHLKKWKCIICESVGTIRSEGEVFINHCDKEVQWQNR